MECEDPQGEMGKEGRVVLAANDRRQDLADGRKQQRVDYQPSLTEERGGEVPPHGRSAHLGREGEMLIPGVGVEIVELMPNLARRMILSGTFRRGPPSLVAVAVSAQRALPSAARS